MPEVMSGVPFSWFVGFFFVLGAVLGSFANVVILRLPKGESVAFPASRCPKCKFRIRWYDNVPILSWVVLRGRCRSCETAISWRYPLVELITASLFALLFVKVGFSWILLEYLIFAFGLVVVTFIDYDHLILPDSFTLSGIVIGLLGAWLNPEREFWSALGGVLMGGGFLWAVATVYYALRKEEGMGGGDIKLLGWIGAVLGWTAIPFVILGSSIVGSLVGIVAALQSKEGLKTTIPFGPYIVFAAIIHIFAGAEISHWYLSLFLPIDPSN